MRAELDATLMPYHRPIRDRSVDQLRFSLGKEGAAAAIAEGQGLLADDAINLALAVCERAESGQAENRPDAATTLPGMAETS